MTVALPRHLVTVWNPSYATDPMDQHLAVLLALVERADRGQVDEDDVYVWWGKVRSQNRQQPQAHPEDLRALAKEVDADERGETQIYLTDYRSLFVGDVDAIVEAELPASEKAHVPAYYAAEGLNCDFWFKLRDIRRLVSDDLNAVIAELKVLRNVHYNDRPVSLYGGMVDMPLVVTRPDGRVFFDMGDKDAQTDGKLWVEFDREMGSGIAAMERELRDNMFGESAWNALEPMTRVNLAAAEKTFRERRGDRGFDFGMVVTSWSKALEIQVNAMLRRAGPKLKREDRLVNVDGRTIDFMSEGSLTLGALATVIGGGKALNEGLRAILEHGPWFAASLPAIMNAFRREVRNDGTHSARVDRATAVQWRNQLMGIGSTGVFVELAKVRVRQVPTVAAAR